MSLKGNVTGSPLTGSSTISHIHNGNVLVVYSVKSNTLTSSADVEFDSVAMTRISSIAHDDGINEIFMELWVLEVGATTANVTMTDTTGTDYMLCVVSLIDADAGEIDYEASTATRLDLNPQFTLDSKDGGIVLMSSALVYWAYTASFSATDGSAEIYEQRSGGDNTDTIRMMVCYEDTTSSSALIGTDETPKSIYGTSIGVTFGPKIVSVAKAFMMGRNF